MQTGKRQDRLIRRIACTLLCIVSLLPLPTFAEQVPNKVLLVNSGLDTLYQEYAQMLQSYLQVLGEGRYSTEITSLGRLDPQLETSRYKLIITSGARAAEQIMARMPTAPVLVTFIPSNEYHADSETRYRCRATSCTYLFLDQPPDRQIRFVRLLFPERTRLGLFNHQGDDRDTAEYQRRAQQHNIRLVPIAVRDSEAVVDALQKSIADIDVLLAHPDTRLINRNTAKGILLTTYYNRVPLLAYSSSFVKAGATAGLYSAPDELARHAAETALQLLDDKAPVPRSAYPKYFRVEINSRVSDSLDLKLPPAETILEKLKNDEAK